MLTPRACGVDRFEAAGGRGGWARLYGGQVIAQALAAATATVDPLRLAHSVHAYFVRPGRFDIPITFDVAKDRDGRSFSARRVVASQEGEAILTLLASFHVLEPGVSHSGQGLPNVPAPEDLPSFVDMLPSEVRAAQVRGPMGEMDIRPIEGCTPNRQEAAPPRAMMWFRIPAGASDDAALQRVLLSYASDMFLISTAMRPHPELTLERTRLASIDHAIWFHDEARVDEWLLYKLDSPWAGRARGLARGEVLARDGRLVASVVQEGLIRAG
jgi:acyl-CoA thioesterase-2